MSTRQRGGVAAPSAPTAPPTSTRTRTRTPAASSRKAATSADDGELADELSRVLQISQPKVPPASKRTTAGSSSSVAKAPAKAPLPPVNAVRTVTKASSAANLRTGPSGNTADSAITVSSATRPRTAAAMRQPQSRHSSAQPEAGPSRLPAPAKAAGLARPRSPIRPKSKAPAAPRSLPDWVTDTTLSNVQRGKAASTAFNSANSSLAAASRAGYRLGRSVEAGGEKWSDERVGELVDDARVAIGVLREMHDDEKSRNGMEVERVFLSLVQRCLGFAMYDTGLDMLCASRERISKLYTSGNESIPPATASRSKEGSALGLPEAWRDLLAMPHPTQPESLAEPLRILLFQFSIYAWIGIMGVRQRYRTQLASLFPTHTSEQTPPTSLNPLHLATSLPLHATVPLLRLLLRFADTTSSTSPDWPAAARLSLSTRVLTTTPSPPSNDAKTLNPGELWCGTHEKLHSWIKEADGDLRIAAEILLDTVGWAEEVVQIRKEDRRAWFGGKAWMGLMDLWISIGRKLSDSEIIDEALSRMTGAASIAYPLSTQDDQAGPSTPDSSTPPVQLMRPTPARSGSSRRAVQKISDAEEAVLRHCAELTSLCILLDKVLDSPLDDIITASAQSALNNFPLLSLSDALASLDDSDSGRAAFEKAARRLESVRRGCEKILSSTEVKVKSETESLGAAIHVWLIGAVDIVEDFIQTTPIDLSTISAKLCPLASGAIDSLIAFIQASDPSSKPQVYLDRIHRFTLLCRPFIPSEVHVDWVRASTLHSYNHAYTLYKVHRFADAQTYARLSVDRVDEMVHYLNVPEMNSEERRKCRVDRVLESLSSRWEMIGLLALKVQDYPAMHQANTAALANIAQSVLEKLPSLSAAQQYRPFWQALQRLDELIRRLVNPVLVNPMQASASTDALLQLSIPVKGQDGEIIKALLLERWFEALERGLHLPGIADAAMRIAEGVLEVYKADMVPVRRMRFICRVLGVVLQTGVGEDRARGLLDELDELGQRHDLDLDVSLAASISECRATGLLLRALFAHRLGTSPDSTAEVSVTAGKAMDELRRMILPPSTPRLSTSAPPAPVPQPRSVRIKQPLGRATTTPAPRTTTTAKARTVSETKTPKRSTIDVRKVSEATTTPASSPALPSAGFNDLPRLISLLSSLISLLGLLALPLQKIEGLKLARALMRANEAMLGECVILSSRLGTEYAKLGKWGRATAVFNQAKRGMEGKATVEDEKKAEWGLRWTAVLAQMGKVEEAKKEYEEAYAIHLTLTSGGGQGGKAPVPISERAGKYERAALARAAYAAILVAEGKSTLIIPHLSASYRLYTRYVEFIASLGPEIKVPNGDIKKAEEDDPFGAPSAAKPPLTGANQPAKDALVDKYPSIGLLDNRLLSGIQWHATEAFLGSVLDLASAYSVKGKATDVDYFLKQTKQIGEIVKSPLIVARSEARLAELDGRLRNYEASSGRLGVADALFVNSDGPDAVESRIIHGDLLEKQESAQEALEVFKKGGEDIEGLEEGFGKKEALLPTPERPAAATKPFPPSAHKDRLLPSTLAHVLRQRLWLGRNEGMGEVEKGELVRQIQALSPSTSEKAEEMYLNGRLALLEVLKVFKTDLFMSSLTDSTIAMPMSTLTRRTQDRHSTRRTVNSLLAKSAAAFHTALELMEQDGRIEDVRQAGMSLALLHAFQTSLGEGGEGLANAAADLLASTSSITMRREMVDVISAKFIDGPQDDLPWPSLTPKPLPPRDDDEDEDNDQALRDTWSSISARLQSPTLTSSTPIDLSPLPANWAVVSISVAADHSTMFLSRHQRGHDPLVLCLPLDRQGKREGEDSPLPFQAALDELAEIVETSDQQARVAKHIVTPPKRQEWWEARHALDARLGELVASMEENWLGAFKSILKPQSSITPKKIQLLRGKMEKLFNEALAGIGTDMRRVKSVRLDDAVLACFATLDGSTKEEEVEDLVYFVLDFYGFHGIQIAIAELDIDQIGVDVKQALHDITNSCPPSPTSQSPEHLFLVLDKNVQGFPWESIPVLRGQPVSRIPSLPFLLDHLQLARLTSPEKNGLLSVNARRVFYVLNPSGDLSRTQTHFEPWLEQMKARAGWKGIVGRPPTDLELGNALRNSDLVLYFGHGGAEQYIRSKRVRDLPKCATTFLWGCSSGLLKDQGDLDRSGTAWNYMMGGCPSLIANLWDVTDRDIDRLSAEVHKKLGLDASHLGRSLQRPSGKMSAETALLPLSGMSTVQALNASRDECRLKYLTGAAPVVYGLPVWMF